MTRRLQALRVGNFKAFAATQRIPLKPITLIFGPNSAGKSSFIHSLALAHEAQFGREKRGRSRLDVHHTDIGGTAIDLGGFRQYIFRSQLNRRMEWGAELKVAELDPLKDRRLAELLAPVQTISISISLGIELDQEERPKPGAEPRVDSIEISADGAELLRMSWRPAAGKTDTSGTALRMDRVAADHAVFRQVLGAIVENQTTSEQMRPEDFEVASEAIASLLPQLIVRVEHFFPASVDLPKSDSAELSPASMLFPVSKGNRKEDIAQAIRFLLPRILSDLIKGLTDALADELAQLQYLGPLRSFPPRHLAFAESEDANWYAGGGYAWDVVRRDDVVRKSVNDWLGAEKLKTRYRLVVRSFKDVHDLREPVATALEDFEAWKESRETSTGEMQSEVDQLTFEIQELAEELDSGREFQEKIRLLSDPQGDEAGKEAVVKELVEALSSEDLGSERNTYDRIASAMDARTSAGDKGALAEVLSALSAKIEELGSRHDSMNQALAEMENGLHSRLGEDLSEVRTEDLLKDLTSSESETIRELALIDQRTGATVSHRDVGIGISQVLPVLVMAYGSNGKILAMEQPEIHLHPALQAELGDVFIESALGQRKNTFILETHSEHLILRIMRRLRESSEGNLPASLPRLTAEDVQVLYVEPLHEGSAAREMPLNSHGELVKAWPGGFFEEGLREVMP